MGHTESMALLQFQTQVVPVLPEQQISTHVAQLGDEAQGQDAQSKLQAFCIA
jgi:hypothetical protein